MSDPAPARTTSRPVASRRRDIVPDGLRFHRQRVLQFGPLMSLAVPVVSAIFGLLLLDGSESTWRGLVGFVAILVATPTAPVLGMPAVGGTGRWAVALLSSAVLWCVLGFVAARRSTRRMASSWPEWRKEWLRLAFGAWAGALIGIALSGAYLLLLT